MKRLRTILFCRKAAGVLTGAFCWAFGNSIIALGEPVLQPPVRLANGTFELRVNGTADGPVVVQKSNDLKAWTDLGTVRVSKGQAAVVDSDPAGPGERFYRLKLLPPDLPDLYLAENSVFMAGEGFNTLQFSPSGMLGFIVWRDQALIYRERSREGVWTEETVSQSGSAWARKDYDDHRFQPAAVLLYDSNSRPHVLRATGASEQIAHHIRQPGGLWTADSISAPFHGPFPALLAAAISPSDALHLAVVSHGSSPAIQHGANQSGRWQWSRVATINGQARGFLPQAYSPRFFSLAVDSRGFAHLAFTPEFRMPSGPGGYMKPASDLAYACNRSGAWKVETVYGPNDGTGDAGLGASVALGPDDEPAIASWYNERAPTGSAQWSQLLFHRRGANGQWHATAIAKSPDGYQAGDGPRGAGFAPYLRFADNGVAHIVFSDHASEHFSSGQNEFAGQLRHAWFDGRAWNLRTVYRQSGPLRSQFIYPALAVHGNEVVCMGLERRTQWRSDYRVAASAYRFIFVPGRFR